MEVSISKPTHIGWKYNNINETANWNKDVAKSLGEVGKEIVDHEADIIAVKVEKDKLFKEHRIGGFVGYAFEDSSSDTYYLDFSVKIDRSDIYDYDSERKATTAILSKLAEYLALQTGTTTLNSCEMDISDEYDIFTLRAQFTANPNPDN